MSETNPDNQGKNRNPDGTFKKGMSGNLKGRPKGQSLKEYDRERFSRMTDEEKEAFLSKVNPGLRYRMAEGNPKKDPGRTWGFNISQVLNEMEDGE